MSTAGMDKRKRALILAYQCSKSEKYEKKIKLFTQK